MAKNLKRPLAVNGKKQLAATRTKPSKNSVNGHGLRDDDGFTAGDDEAPAAVSEEDPWADDADDNNPHGDDEAGVDATDDPVRMYLMQMGQIPLLNRAQEISSAKQIERTRLRYRHSMLATDYVLQGAVEALEKVRDGQLRLDRTIEVSVTNTTEKKRILKRIWPNLATL